MKGERDVGVRANGEAEAYAARIREGDVRALARAISWLEAGDGRGARVLAALRSAGPPAARLIGVTGSPGSGKSTLVDRLVGWERARGNRVAVVAVDPTSPYSGGAILGDRVRMMRWHDDPGVFVRSMATRGHLGGVATATLQVVALLEAAMFDRVIVETVGVGQSEVDIVSIADTTVLVLTPSSGDGVQAFKAGVSEIADLFAINKRDLPGADRLRREVRAAQELGAAERDGWRPPVVLTRADAGEGVDALGEALDAHAAHLAAREGGAERLRGRVRAELAAALRARARAALDGREESLVDAVLRGALTADEAAAQALRENADGTLPPP